MKNKIKTALVGIIALSVSVMSIYALECQNKGYVTGWADCKAVDYCSNHSSSTTCTTAQINWQVRNTGTVNGEYINLYNDVCTQDVTCTWDVFCSEAVNGGGDTHNGQFPDEEDCD